MMTDYQDQTHRQATEYALKAALGVPFMMLPMAELMVRVRDELRHAFLAGAESRAGKNFADTQRT